jgi:hypothetical protein
MPQEKTLSDPGEMLSFTTALIEGVRKAVNETKTFSSMAFVIATLDPQTKTQYDSPKAVPISLELVFEVLGEEKAKEVLSMYEDPTELFEHMVRLTAEHSKAIGVVLITSGTAREVALDPETKEPTGEESTRDAILVVMQHLRCTTCAWIATIELEGENLKSVSKFEPMQTVEGKGIAKGILPLWN